MAKRLPAEPPVLPGYTYVRPLGTGGFADVFLYEQQLPRRSVAVKVLLHTVTDPELVRMFNAEADVMARLSAHPSILTVHEASISADGRPYLVMEYCPSSYAAKYRRESLSVEEVLSLGVKIAGALETAHRNKVLHRDIKPSNLLITAFGAPVLSDFGIAMAMSGDRTGAVAAMSLPWSAPEVVNERELGTVQSEVWSLGATLYTLLAGRSPFEMGPVTGTEQEREQLKARIARAAYTSIGRPDVHPAVEAVLARAMTKDPKRRHQSMAELGAELQQAQQAAGIHPTALEVPVEAWAPVAVSSEVRFDDVAVRGPVISQVAVASPRRRQQTKHLPSSIDQTATYEDSLRNAPLPQQVRGWFVRVLVGAVVTAGFFGIALLVLSWLTERS